MFLRVKVWCNPFVCLTFMAMPVIMVDLITHLRTLTVDLNSVHGFQSCTASNEEEGLAKGWGSDGIVA